MDSFEYELTEETVAQFEETFGTLHDSVITNFEFSSGSTKEEGRKLSVHLEAQNYSVREDERDSSVHWGKLTFRFHDVEQFAIVKTWNYDLEVIWRAITYFANNQIIVDFNSQHKHDPRERLKSYDFERGKFFAIVAAKCWVRFEPFADGYRDYRMPPRAK